MPPYKQSGFGRNGQDVPADPSKGGFRGNISDPIPIQPEPEKPQEVAPYTIPYTGSAAVHTGSGYVSSADLIGPGTVRTPSGGAVSVDTTGHRYNDAELAYARRGIPVPNRGPLNSHPVVMGKTHTYGSRAIDFSQNTPQNSPYRQSAMPALHQSIGNMSREEIEKQIRSTDDRWPSLGGDKENDQKNLEQIDGELADCLSLEDGIQKRHDQKEKLRTQERSRQAVSLRTDNTNEDKNASFLSDSSSSVDEHEDHQIRPVKPSQDKAQLHHEGRNKDVSDNEDKDDELSSAPVSKNKGAKKVPRNSKDNESQEYVLIDGELVKREIWMLERISRNYIQPLFRMFGGK